MILKLQDIFKVRKKCKTKHLKVGIVSMCSMIQKDSLYDNSSYRKNIIAEMTQKILSEH